LARAAARQACFLFPGGSYTIRIGLEDFGAARRIWDFTGWQDGRVAACRIIPARHGLAANSLTVAEEHKQPAQAPYRIPQDASFIAAGIHLLGYIS